MNKTIKCYAINHNSGEIRVKNFENHPADDVNSFLSRQKKKMGNDDSIVFEVNVSFSDDNCYLQKIPESLLKSAGIEKAVSTWKEDGRTECAEFSKVSDAAFFIKMMKAA